jgi:hypothetical protein
MTKVARRRSAICRLGTGQRGYTDGPKPPWKKANPLKKAGKKSKKLSPALKAAAKRSAKKGRAAVSEFGREYARRQQEENRPQK